MKLRDNKYISLELNEKIAAAENNQVDKSHFIEKDRMLEKLTEAVKLLNPEQQQCVNLFYLEKKSYAEVATITGFSLLQVKSHLQNGKRNLKLIIENNKNN